MYESVLGLKKPIMGLDIGYKTLKVMQLRGDGPGAKVVGVAEIQIPPKILSKEGIKEKKSPFGSNYRRHTKRSTSPNYRSDCFFGSAGIFSFYQIG